MSTRKSILTFTTAAIQAQVDAANGRRSARTVNFSEAIQAIREALRDGYGYVNGGTVANSYGYAAVQTQVTAIAVEQTVIVNVLTANAKKGTGTGLPWTRAANEEKIRTTILDLVWCPARNGEFRLTRKQAKAIVAAQDHADAIRAAERIPADVRDSKILITAADSLAAGNCESETCRVQSWFPGRDTVPANEVLAVIIKRAPSLISFAVRAIKYAQSHVVAA